MSSSSVSLYEWGGVAKAGECVRSKGLLENPCAARSLLVDRVRPPAHRHRIDVEHRSSSSYWC